MTTSSAFYPYASGSLYTSSFALSSSYANNAQYLMYVFTASFAESGTSGSKGDLGVPGICKITYEQYLQLRANPSLKEVCNFN
jgi:hypothetical protein